jgi:hypothetical protein
MELVATGLVHPFKVYVAEYVVVDTGETVKVDVVLALPVQVYVPPIGDPVAVTVALSPEQMVELLTVTVGIGFTVTTPVPVALQQLSE